jgi:6-phosphofructokinase 1
MTSQKRIGILTSGGDCPGLNAAIRAAAHTALEKGWEVLGIIESTDGLMVNPPNVITMTAKMLDGNVLRSAGTILGTTSKGAQSPLSFTYPDGTKKDRSQEVADAYKALGLEGIIVIGGDGSMGILREIAKRTNGGIKFVGVPKTIDNDVGATEQSIGFDTAVAVAAEALDRLQPTAASHQRAMILEVMGRDAGHIALNAGISGGADVILIPELPYTLEAVCKKIEKLRAEGRNHSLICVAEGVKMPNGDKVQVKFADGQLRNGGIGQFLAAEINTRIGAECRVTVLGHVQRGAAPNAMDRLVATALGVHAVNLVEKGMYDRMVVWQGRSVTSVPLAQALDKYHTVDPNSSLVITAKSMGICLGE